MFKPVGASSVSEYIATLPAERKAIIVTLDKLIRATAPSLKRHFAYNMLGYGTFKYKNYKGEIIDWPTVALASQKQYISLYVCALDGKQYLAEKFKKDLGKVSVGKSCIRFKKLEDLDLKTVKKVISLAAKKPGLKTD
jgi:uncharacterized protein YdhG (YjbR/CyaY superfamily)